MPVTMAWKVIGENYNSTKGERIIKLYLNELAKQDVRGIEKTRTDNTNPPPPNSLRRFCHIVDMHLLRSELFYRYRLSWMFRRRLDLMPIEQEYTVAAIFSIAISYAKGWMDPTRKPKDPNRKKQLKDLMYRTVGRSPATLFYPELPDILEYELLSVPSNFLRAWAALEDPVFQANHLNQLDGLKAPWII